MHLQDSPCTLPSFSSWGRGVRLTAQPRGPQPKPLLLSQSCHLPRQVGPSPRGTPQNPHSTAGLEAQGPLPSPHQVPIRPLRLTTVGGREGLGLICSLAALRFVFYLPCVSCARTAARTAGATRCAKAILRAQRTRCACGQASAAVATATSAPTATLSARASSGVPTARSGVAATRTGSART